MSYTNDKKNMNEQIARRKNKLILIIKITFIALSVSLVALLITLFATLFLADEPPVIQPASSVEVVGYVGAEQAPTYKKYVTVTDDKDTPEDLLTRLEVNATAVRLNKEGTYPVYYKVKDSSGNESYFTINYKLIKNDYPIEKLNEIVARIAAENGITEDLDTETKIRKIYAFANTIIAWSGGIGTSNIPNINRNNWKTDWIQEAIRTLELYERDECEGDCYSYYSVSKAFFEYFGIKNIGLRRDMAWDNKTDSNGDRLGTHFWQIVSVDGDWYYYDATRLKGSFTNACLITQEKLDSYVTSSGGTYFYKISKQPQCVDYSSAGISVYPQIAK